MNRKLCRSQGLSGRKEEKIRWPFTGNEPQFLGRPDRSQVNTPTVLFRLMHGGENRVGLIILNAGFQTITWGVKKSVTVNHSYVWRYLGYLNKGWPPRWHLLYYILLNMFQTLKRLSSGASEYLLCCVGWLEACWCYVARLSVGDVVSECRLNHYYQHASGQPTQHNKYLLAPEEGRINVWNMLSNI